MLFVFLAICIGLYFLIQAFVFKENSPEYKKSCRLVIISNLIFFALCGSVAFISIEVVSGMFSPYDKWMETGSNFGQLGVGVASQLAEMDMRSRFEANTALSDYAENASFACVVSIILGIIVFVFGWLSINGIRNRERKSLKTLSTFYFISSILAAISLGFFGRLCSALHAVSEGGEPNYLLSWILWFVVSAGYFIFIYFRRYKPAMIRTLDMDPFPMVFNFGRPQKSRAQTIVSAVSQAVNNPDADKPTKSCPFCGETILAVAVKCKHCGEWLPKEEQKKMVECPVCGEMVEEGIDVCPYCHEKMDGSSIKRKEPQVRMIACPVCAEQIPDNVAVCPICNEKIK